MEEPPRIVDWYRADSWPRMRGVLLSGPSVVTLGGIVIALSFVARIPGDLRYGATVAGLALVAGGAIFTMVGMNRILRDDVYLSLRTDGVAVRIGGRETLVRWDALAVVRWDAERGELVLQSTDGCLLAVPRRFRGVAGADLAKRIVQAQRKAAMGLLR